METAGYIFGATVAKRDKRSRKVGYEISSGPFLVDEGRAG